jgi:hypothetical protein
MPNEITEQLIYELQAEIKRLLAVNKIYKNQAIKYSNELDQYEQFVREVTE